MRRLARIYGRNDNMVKLRDVNVFPEAVGAAVAEDRRSNGEFFCFVDRVGEAGVDQPLCCCPFAQPPPAAASRETRAASAKPRLLPNAGDSHSLLSLRTGRVVANAPLAARPFACKSGLELRATPAARLYAAHRRETMQA